MAYHALAFVQALSLLGQLGPAAGRPAPPAAAPPREPSASPPAAAAKPDNEVAPAAPLAKPGEMESLRAEVSTLRAELARAVDALAEEKNQLATTAKAAEGPRATATPVTATGAAAAASAAPSVKPVDKAEETKAISLLPLEFTAFGDLFYQFSRPDEDGFYIGAIELDASLSLSHWVNVATAIAFNGADDEFGLGAFVIDCGIFGQGEGYPIQSQLVEKSGVSFGKFDVPFGAAYLEYPAVSNRLVTLPEAVMATHGGWNDVGAQAYALAEHWTGTAYIVNGPAYPTTSGEERPARSAVGGRFSAKLATAELGGSSAWVFGPSGAAELFAGADLSGVLGPLDLRAEYLLKRVDVEGPDDTHGIYGRAILNLEPAFLVARYETLLADSTILDRRFTVGGGVEIFRHGEVRAVYQQSVDSDARMVVLQLVGGSTFQPTGLRR
jgi:hypothetical protein